VPYRVQFRCPTRRVPIRVLDQLRERLREISHTLGAVSSSSSFWSSLTENPLFVEVAGWRFNYAIHRESKQFEVLEARRASDRTPADQCATAQSKREA
jgi:hypothetical protein